ncbi:MAG: nitrilase-related carbon-nitrogen hydrolase [Hyphomicrobiaceae bacterium]
MPNETITLALWATNLAKPLNGIGAWAEHVEAKLAEAKAAGAKLMVMPEYASEQWLSFKPDGLAPDAEIAWMAGEAPAAVELLKAAVARTGVALLAGSMPWAQGEGFRNRAWLLLPDGRAIAQDKLALTPFEKDPQTWLLATGDEIRIVEWEGLRLATLICLDVEMPALATALGAENLDLLLVPSMTAMLSGYSRVFGCAKARAIELMTTVAVTGCIGSAPGSTQNPTNVSGAAVYVPCEAELGYTGIHGETAGPVGEATDDGPFLIARDVPVAAIRRLREGAAEVWPGAWNGAHVRVTPASA